MRKTRTFKDDKQIGEKLDTIPKDEMSTVIRMALRAWFGITNSKKGVIPNDRHPQNPKDNS